MEKELSIFFDDFYKRKKKSPLFFSRLMEIYGATENKKIMNKKRIKLFFLGEYLEELKKCEKDIFIITKSKVNSPFKQYVEGECEYTVGLKKKDRIYLIKFPDIEKIKEGNIKEKILKLKKINISNYDFEKNRTDDYDYVKKHEITDLINEKTYNKIVEKIYEGKLEEKLIEQKIKLKVLINNVI